MDPIVHFRQDVVPDHQEIAAIEATLRLAGLEVVPVTRIIALKGQMPDDWGGDMTVRLTPDQEQAFRKLAQLPSVARVEI